MYVLVCHCGLLDCIVRVSSLVVSDHMTGVGLHLHITRPNHDGDDV